ncbi:uncharacterized protein MYCGRDRAFT_51748, partial [Zymoseptoria tritici IPO323]
PIRGELKILEFGRRVLLTKFVSGYKVISLLLTYFIDAFSLFRNITRLLIGFYF